MRNVIPEDTILEITPTNVTYSDNGSIINKTFLLDKSRLRKMLSEIDYQKFYNDIGGYKSTNPELERTCLPPASFVYFKLYAKTSKIPSPKQIVDTYIDVFCVKDGNGYKLKEEFIPEKQIYFSYRDIAIYICNRYSKYSKKLFLLAGLAKNHLDCDIIYNYYNEIVNNVDLLISYDNKAFLILFTDNVKVNREFIKELHTEYENVLVINIDVKKIKKENINGVYIFSDDSDEYIFKKTKIAAEILEHDDKVFNSYLDYDLQPFYIVGIEEDFF